MRNGPEFYTVGLHNCTRGRSFAVIPPDINNGKGLSEWKYKRVRRSNYTLIVCRKCNETVAAVY